MPKSEHAVAAERRHLGELANEFAVVSLTLDTTGNGPRLLVEDLESGTQVFLSPLELASFTLATDQDRADWLRVGAYRDERRDLWVHGEGRAAAGSAG
ncbi:hypothetical protein ACFY1V_12480 [Streptomyces sp. NPDC001255]|uniref:hypothetical protein n=1 Tax=Streptomyces sp. NPDC001255 TaxID=3364550 RepID=UPI003688899A